MWEIGTLGNLSILILYILHSALPLICMVVLVGTSLHSML